MENPEKGLPEIPEHVDFDAPDYLLTFYVDLVNLGDLKIPITLLMDGFLVPGYLVGAQTFLKSTLNVIKSEDKDGNDAYEKYIQERINAYNDMDDSKQTVFIHIMEAKFFSNRIGLPDGGRGIHFRGLLSKVSGFFLGIMQ